MIVKNIMLSERSLRQEFIEYDTIHRKCWNKQRKLIYDGKKVRTVVTSERRGRGGD